MNAKELPAKWLVFLLGIAENTRESTLRRAIYTRTIVVTVRNFPKFALKKGHSEYTYLERILLKTNQVRVRLRTPHSTQLVRYLN